MANILFDENLPKEYQNKHGFLMYLQDIAYNLLRLQDNHKLSDLKVKIKNSPDKEINNLTQFLEDNDYKDELITLFKPNLLFSLVRDFSMYMGDSLKSIEGGRVSTAFALSRKPIQDTLFYLCWLLSDSHDLVSKMLWSKDSKEYDVSSFRRNNTKFIKEVFEKSVEITNTVLNSDFLFEKIYKKEENSLTPIWNMSLHIVTGDKNYKTNAGNLNFVFADDGIWNSYWEFYYTNFIHLNFFALNVILSIFEKIFEIPDNIIILNRTIMDLKYQLLFNIEIDESISLLNIIAESISLTCDTCDSLISDSLQYKNEFIYDYSVTCPNCGNVERIGTYFLSSEDINLIKKKSALVIP